MLGQHRVGGGRGGELGEYPIVVGCGVLVAADLPLKLLGQRVHRWSVRWIRRDSFHPNRRARNCWRAPISGRTAEPPSARTSAAARRLRSGASGYFVFQPLPVIGQRPLHPRRILGASHVSGNKIGGTGQ